MRSFFYFQLEFEWTHQKRHTNSCQILKQLSYKCLSYLREINVLLEEKNQIKKKNNFLLKLDQTF
jgi:hypothetical protein